MKSANPLENAATNSNNKKQTTMGKVINWKGEEIEVVSVNEALTFFSGRKGPHMTRRSFMQKVYRGHLKYHKSPKGNYWFDKRELLGFKEENTAA